MSSTNSKTYEASTPCRTAFLGLGVMGFPMAAADGLDRQICIFKPEAVCRDETKRESP